MTYTSPPPAAVHPPASAPNSGTAVAAVVCSALSFVTVPVVLAIVGLVLASNAKREIEASDGRLGGEGLVSAARALAWINIAIGVVLLVALGAVVAFLVVGDNSGTIDVRIGEEIGPTIGLLTWTR